MCDCDNQNCNCRVRCEYKVKLSCLQQCEDCEHNIICLVPSVKEIFKWRNIWNPIHKFNDKKE